MLTVAVAIALLFLFRDLQILAVAGRSMSVRVGSYVLVVAAGVAVFGWLSGGRPGWIEHRFALGAIIVQLLELIAALSLRRYQLGQHCWFGGILPAPAFLLALYVLGWELQAFIPGLGIFTAVTIVTVVWLCMVLVLASILCAFDNPWEDRRFATDFAMMAGSTAAVFVPIWLS